MSGSTPITSSTKTGGRITSAPGGMSLIGDRPRRTSRRRSKRKLFRDEDVPKQQSAAGCIGAKQRAPMHLEIRLSQWFAGVLRGQNRLLPKHQPQCFGLTGVGKRRHNWV